MMCHLRFNFQVPNDKIEGIVTYRLSTYRFHPVQKSMRLSNITRAACPRLKVNEKDQVQEESEGPALAAVYLAPGFTALLAPG